MVELFGPVRLRQDHARIQIVAHAAEQRLSPPHGSTPTTPSTRPMPRAWRRTWSVCRWRSPHRRSRRWKSRVPLAGSGAVDLLVVDSAAALVPQPRTGGRHRQRRPRDLQSRRAGIGPAQICADAARNRRMRCVSQSDAQSAARLRRARARPAPAARRSNFTPRCASRWSRSEGARLCFRVLKNKVAESTSGRRTGVAAGRRIRGKPVKLGLPAHLHAKKLRKIEGFCAVFPLHRPCPSLMIDYVQGWDSLEFRG